jgi:hypothetical protein
MPERGVKNRERRSGVEDKPVFLSLNLTGRKIRSGFGAIGNLATIRWLSALSELICGAAAKPIEVSPSTRLNSAFCFMFMEKSYSDSYYRNFCSNAFYLVISTAFRTSQFSLTPW